MAFTRLPDAFFFAAFQGKKSSIGRIHFLALRVVTRCFTPAVVEVRGETHVTRSRQTQRSTDAQSRARATSNQSECGRFCLHLTFKKTLIHPLSARRHITIFPRDVCRGVLRQRCSTVLVVQCWCQSVFEVVLFSFFAEGSNPHTLSVMPTPIFLFFWTGFRLHPGQTYCMFLWRF